MDTLRIKTISWNVACKPPEECLTKLLGFESPIKNLADIYIIGLQEVSSQIQNLVIDAIFDDPWTNVFKKRLEENDYVKIKTIRLQGTVLSIYALRKHILSIRDVESQYVKTGLHGLWGNKGCVSIRMTVGGVSVCTVNTHLAPHDHNLPTRIQEYNTIVKEVKFDNQRETTMIFSHDYVFWVGDHNFRLNESLSQEEVLSRVSKDELDWLLGQDQLKEVMQKGEAFYELIEPSFRFPPTFKYVIGTSDFDAKRRPAWTDRILYQVTANAYENLVLSAVPKNYVSHPSYTQSDHKPVSCDFTFKTFSDHVDRIVEIALPQTWFIDFENEVTVSPADDVKVNDHDWLGIYKADFSALDEYVHYLFVNPRPIADEDETEGPTIRRTTPSGQIKVRFPDRMIPGPGSYRILYCTHDSGSVLGISAPFTARFSDNSVSEGQSLFPMPLHIPSLAEAARNMSPRRTPSSSPQPSPSPSLRQSRGVSPSRSHASASSSSSADTL